VIGINKGSVAQLSLKRTQLRRTTSNAEPLDAILERHRRSLDIDCFVVAWDLVPPWDKMAGTCRWLETLGLYEGLSLSETLDRRFRDFASARFQGLQQRTQPSARRAAPQLIPGAVIAVCMEPLFESIFMNERAMKISLGVHGKRTKEWPSRWQQGNARASSIIEAAVDAARDAVPANSVFRRIRQGYETLKSEWGIHFVQSRAFDNTLKNHPLGRRLAEIRVARSGLA